MPCKSSNELADSVASDFRRQFLVEGDVVISLVRVTGLGTSRCQKRPGILYWEFCSVWSTPDTGTVKMKNL